MTAEQATAEAFARLMEDRRGGKWLPVERNERDVAVSRARKSRRSLTSPQDENPAIRSGPVTTIHSPLPLSPRQREGRHERG